MTEYDDELRGVLFRNEHKREGKKDADYRGRATVAGTEYWLDAWVNSGKTGKYMALRFKAKEAKPEAPAPAPASAPAEQFNDEIPF